MSCGILPDYPALVFRINDNGMGPELLRQVFLERGWAEFDEDTQYDYDWNLWWRTSRFRTSDYDVVYPWQRLNHYPKSTMITKKDALARNLKRMRCVHGASVFNFSPLSFNLPNDYTKYVKAYGAMRQKVDGKAPYWICKPADLSRGRGIFIFRDLSELMYDCNAVVQHYIDNPLLIGGYKFDLRIYVAVTSFQPLRSYIHDEGIVRFSTEKFDLNSTKNVFAHLTNTSINKHSPGFSEDKERVGPGCKWTLTQLRHYFLSSNIDDQMLWRRIVNIVVLTLLVQAPSVQKVENCFELYGFDILIDQNLKPWLLEVNFSPSLSSDCQADLLAKKPMLHDLIDLMHFTSADGERGGENFKHYFKTFVMKGTFQQTLQAQRDSVGANKRNEKPRIQGRKVNRIHSGRTDSSMLAGSRENLTVGMSPTGPSNSSQEDILGREERKSGAASVSRNSKKETDEEGRRRHGSGVVTRKMDRTNRNDREEIPDSRVDPTEDQLQGESEQHSHPTPLNKQHSKTTVSAESHNSGGSDDSKVSKGSMDSGIGSISKSAGSSSQTPHHNVFGSLPEMSSQHRVGSGVNRKDSGCGEELALHLPSLEVSTKGRQSKKTVLTPTRKMFHHAAEEAEKSRKFQHGHFHKSASENATQWRQRLEDSQPMTHRSVASMPPMPGQPGVMTGSRGYRKQSSMSHYPNVPPTSRFMQGQPRQQQRFSPQNKNSLHSNFSHVKKRCGDFFLVFPFNEATHKVATTLDAKVIIRETQNLIRESLHAVSSSKSSADHSGYDSSFGREIESLWAPLKAPKEET